MPAPVPWYSQLTSSVYTHGPLARKHSMEPIGLTTGGRVIHRRTRWSPSLCNAVAALAGIGTEH